MYSKHSFFFFSKATLVSDRSNEGSKLTHFRKGVFISDFEDLKTIFVIHHRPLEEQKSWVYASPNLLFLEGRTSTYIISQPQNWDPSFPWKLAYLLHISLHILGNHESRINIPVLCGGIVLTKQCCYVFSSKMSTSK